VSPRAIGPRVGITSGGATGGWVVIFLCWGLVAVFGLTWCAAKLAAALSGGQVEPFGYGFVADILHADTATAWPGTPTPLVIASTVVVLGASSAAVILIARWVLGRMPEPDDPVKALADNPGLAPCLPIPAAKRAIQLRNSLKGQDPKRLATGDIGLALGDLRRPGRLGPVLYASWEDTILTFMAPRSGKTTAQSIPLVLAAPGAVIATSNKGDLWEATAEIRQRDRGGHVWLFDPQSITHQPREWWWNPLKGLHTVEDADRTASHFVLTVADEKVRDLWGPAAQDLLAQLLLAAASSGRTMRDIGKWLDEPGVPTPVDLLAKAGFRMMASSLRGTQNGAVETRDGIYQTARTAAKALRDEQITAWITPPEDGRVLPVFDPDAFAASVDTLYLLSKSRSAAAPLIAALTDITMRAAERHAERLGGRLDPPMVVALDEAANICRINDLPELYSHLGSRGIIPITILQSYEQGQNVWGEHGMAAMWGAATRKVIGAGVDSPRLARDVATLVGQHDVATRSITYGEGRASEQLSTRRQDILEPADIRAQAPGTAILLATGGRPALMKLRPWYTSPLADRISACAAAAKRKITEGAKAADAARAARETAGEEDRDEQDSAA
jgi:type IV secretory pathway TraG/TraD family ATPase VirD4